MLPIGDLSIKVSGSAAFQHDGELDSAIGSGTLTVKFNSPSPVLSRDPSGTWSIQLENTDPVRALFTSGSILDIVPVLTVTAVAPEWPE